MEEITLYQLLEFHRSADPKTMQTIWGDTIGSHVWQVFKRNDHQLPLWKLGGEDMAKVSAYIKANYPSQPK
jgi:hypothetical protein